MSPEDLETAIRLILVAWLATFVTWIFVLRKGPEDE